MATATKKPNCTVGYGCGNACINQKETCVEEFGPEVADFIGKVVEQIGGGQRAKTEAGSATISKEELTALMDPDNAKFLQSSTPKQIVDRAIKRGQDELGFQVTDKINEAVWAVLPTKAKTHLKAKGSLKKGQYLNPETGEHEGANTARGKALLKRYLQQNGRDAYTGQPIGLLDSDLEHIEPHSKNGNKAERLDNWAFTSQAANQQKAELSMKEFYETKVEPKAKAASEDPEFWKKEAEALAAKRKSKNAVQDLVDQTPKDAWTNDAIDNLGAKYYYAPRAMGHPMSYNPRVRGGARNLPKGVGAPLTKAFAKAYRDGDQEQVDRLEAFRAELKEVASKSGQDRGGKTMQMKKGDPGFDLFASKAKELGFDEFIDEKTRKKL